jgi:hypothetical protein
MHTTLNKFILAASLAAPLFAVAGAAHADPLITLRDPAFFQSERADYTRPVAVQETYSPYYGTRAYDARASMDYAPIPTSRCTYQGGPKTGTMSCGY